jgi:hypothetical protein
MRDMVVVALVVLAFAAFVTVHLAIVAGLARRSSVLHAVAALLVFPLAPYWAARNRMRVRAGAWLGFGLLYALARTLASR